MTKPFDIPKTLAVINAVIKVTLPCVPRTRAVVYQARGALSKMRAGPSKPVCRRRLQTTSSRVGQEPSW